MNRPLFVLALLCAVAAAGCKSAEAPVAGELEVRLTTPNTDDRAVLFLLRGAQTAVTVPSGAAYRVLQSPAGTDSLRVLILAPLGGHLAAGALVRVAVPDTRQATSYVAHVLDVASTAYAQRALTGYGVTVVLP